MHGCSRFASIALVAMIAACRENVGPGAGAPNISGEWVFSQLLVLGPEDECGASGYFVFSQTATSFTAAVASQGGWCGVIPAAGVVQDGRLSESGITFTFGLCRYSGTFQGARPDSIAGTFSCSTLTGTGTWSAGRLGPAASLTLTNWPNHQRIVVGGTVSLGAVLRDAAGHTVFGPPVAWTSDDSAVVSVRGPSTASGEVSVTGVGTGSAGVTATSSGFSASARFTVTQVRFASVSAGWTGTCGVAVAGGAYCWGGGPLGDSIFGGSATPVPVSGSLAFASLSVGGAGGGNECGVASGGVVYCWGSWPVAVSSALAFTSVSVGGSHTCGVTTGGAAYCWGYNLNGELGIGSTTGPEQCSGYPCSTTPVAVSGGLRFVAVSAGAVHSCGLTTGGAAYCWGYNSGGQLGNGSTANSSSPVAVAGGLTFTAVSAGGDHTCGRTTGGVAYCWGYNYDGELGTGSTTGPEQCSGYPCSTAPVAVSGGLTFVAVSAGEQHTCGVTTGGQAYCWGLNDLGQLGIGSTINSSTPAAVSGGFTFQSVSAGLGNAAHTCGLTTGGVAYCWGYNYSGQLGNGSTTSSSTPVQVAGQP